MNRWNQVNGRNGKRADKHGQFPSLVFGPAVFHQVRRQPTEENTTQIGDNVDDQKGNAKVFQVQFPVELIVGQQKVG